MVETMAERAAIQAKRDAMPMFSSGHDGSVFPLEGRLDHDKLDQFLAWTTQVQASDVTFQSDDVVRLEIGGKLERGMDRPLTHPELEDAVRNIYANNGPGDVLSGNDLDFSYEMKNPHFDERGRRLKGSLRYRVNVTQVRTRKGPGFQITVRTLPSNPPPLSALGIEQGIMDNFRPAQGMNLVTGPTGSGKSLLLASFVRWLCEQEERHEKVLDYSKPIEYVYDGLDFPHSIVGQTEVGRQLRPRGDEPNEATLWEYSTRNALRRKPTVCVIGEARDAPTIKGCLGLASTGHLLLSTMHTIGVAETLQRAIEVFPAGERRGSAALMLETLNLVVTQLLVPKLVNGKPAGKIAVREWMHFDAKVRSELVEVESDLWPSMIRRMLANGKVSGRTMGAAAKELYDKGSISRETYITTSARTLAPTEASESMSMASEAAALDAEALAH